MVSNGLVAKVAALAGDPGRASMLNARMDGRALTATELTRVAGITPQTASGHLSRMIGVGLLSVEKQGRHRYYRLADADVAKVLESLMGVAARSKALRTRPGPKEPAIGKPFAWTAGSCMTVVGHTSKSGPAAVNDALSLKRAATIKQKLVAEQPVLALKTTAEGMGFRQNIVGSGTDNSFDVLDRRVEFKIVPCR